MSTDGQKLGELIGTVNGLTKAFDTMQKAQENNRAEFMGVFKDMRDSMKEVAVGFAQHLQDDNVAHSTITSLQTWRDGQNGKNGAADKIDTMWDGKNKTAGMFSVSRLFGGGVWAMVVLGVGYFLK